MELVSVFIIILLSMNVHGNPSNACGFAKHDTGISPSSHVESWPWVATLRLKESGRFLCGATLISHQQVDGRGFLLTAAHCIQEKGRAKPLDPSETVASIRLTSSINISHTLHPGKFDIHPEWKFDEPSYNADLAIISFRDELLSSFKISPICLWKSSNEPRPEHGFMVRGTLSVEHMKIDFSCISRLDR